jgi:hypothetical protein
MIVSFARKIVILRSFNFLQKIANKLLGRLLRYLASVRMIKETGKDTYQSSRVTEALSQKASKGGIGH